MTGPTGGVNPGGSKPGSEWEQRRRAIVQAAADVFFELGFEKGTTKEIANRVGLSQPSVYHYVGSKTALMNEIARQVDADLTAALDRSVATGGGPLQQLRLLVVNFTETILECQSVYASYWQEQRSIEPEVASEVLQHEADFIKRVTDLVMAAQLKEGWQSHIPTSILARSVVGMVWSSYRWYQPGGPLTPGEIGSQFAELLGLPSSS